MPRNKIKNAKKQNKKWQENNKMARKQQNGKKTTKWQGNNKMARKQQNGKKTKEEMNLRKPVKRDPHRRNL